MALTSTKIKNAKAKLKLYKLYDEKSLYLEITPKGGKRWHLKYRFNNKEKRISLGVYPEISLKDVRDRRDENRKLLAISIKHDDRFGSAADLFTKFTINNLSKTAFGQNRTSFSFA